MFRITAVSLCGLLLSVYAWGLVDGLATGSVFAALGDIWSRSWGPATLIDLGVSLLLLLAWGWQIERRWLPRLLLTLGTLVFGSLAMLLLLCLRLPQARAWQAWLLEPRGAG